LAPADQCFVNASRAGFVQAVEALHRYGSDVLTTEVEDEQMAFVRKFESELQALGFLSGPPDSFWPLIVEQAHDGML
jgi:hypothetical protein